MLHRKHARLRWGNQGAEGLQFEDLDHEQILRPRARHRASASSVGSRMDVSDILVRPGLPIDKQLTNIAQMPYGKKSWRVTRRRWQSRALSRK